mmetsp:Transcript_30974/g.66500  ORF Transcript_30974/g.66500 Transcript_30974/m.66500 type:complete len:389 (+) Transcript_30974:191-1357(+)
MRCMQKAAGIGTLQTTQTSMYTSRLMKVCHQIPNRHANLRTQPPLPPITSKLQSSPVRREHRSSEPQGARQECIILDACTNLAIISLRVGCRLTIQLALVLPRRGTCRRIFRLEERLVHRLAIISIVALPAAVAVAVAVAIAIAVAVATVAIPIPIPIFPSVPLATIVVVAAAEAAAVAMTIIVVAVVIVPRATVTTIPWSIALVVAPIPTVVRPLTRVFLPITFALAGAIAFAIASAITLTLAVAITLTLAVAIALAIELAGATPVTLTIAVTHALAVAITRWLSSIAVLGRSRLLCLLSASTVLLLNSGLHLIAFGFEGRRNALLLLLFQANLLLLLLEKLLGNTKRVLLSRDQQCPQLLHKRRGVLLKEACQVQLHLLWIHLDPL